MKQEINLYYYKYVNDLSDLYKVKDFFSSYRLNKIKNNSNNDNSFNIQTEYAIKLALEHYANNEITKLDFTINEFGKPILNIDNIYLNISHSNSNLVIVISDNNLSVDLEIIDPKHLKLSRKLFIEEDINYSINQVTKAFTIKESYIKYFGKSIMYDLKTINYDDHLITGPLGTINYQTYLINNHYLTISSLNSSNITTYQIKDLNNLLSIEKFNIINKSDE